jgi:hypothetical protein
LIGLESSVRRTVRDRARRGAGYRLALAASNARPRRACSTILVAAIRWRDLPPPSIAAICCRDRLSNHACLAIAIVLPAAARGRQI